MKHCRYDSRVKSYATTVAPAARTGRAAPTSNGSTAKDLGRLKPLAVRRKLGDEVTRYLRDSLITGIYPAGERVRINDIAAELGVSAMPVREALIALASEGLVEMLPRRGFRVGTLQLKDFEDTFRVHAFVAGLLAEEAARSISPEELQQLKAIDAKLQDLARRKAKDRDRLETLNFEFHRAVNYASASPRLRWFLRAATRNIPHRFYGDMPGWIEETVADHPKIIDALERRDPRRARAAMEEHIRHTGEVILANLPTRTNGTQPKLMGSRRTR
jgi:DNA-binding GntR family transcriptional regulator